MQSEGKVGFFSCVLRGILLSVITALIGVLVFALVIKLASLGSGVIKAVNQFLKVLSIFLGCMFSLDGRMGLIKGAIIGVISAVVIYLLFALVLGQMQFGAPFIVDIIFSGVIGGISGIISVNMKKR